MKKVMTLLFVLLLIGCEVSYESFATTTNLNLRICPQATESCATITTLKKGTLVRAKGREGEWTYVYVPSELDSGWVHSSYLVEKIIVNEPNQLLISRSVGIGLILVSPLVGFFMIKQLQVQNQVRSRRYLGTRIYSAVALYGFIGICCLPFFFVGIIVVNNPQMGIDEWQAIKTENETREYRKPRGISPKITTRVNTHLFSYPDFRSTKVVKLVKGQDLLLMVGRSRNGFAPVTYHPSRSSEPELIKGWVPESDVIFSRIIATKGFGEVWPTILSRKFLLASLIDGAVSVIICLILSFASPTIRRNVGYIVFPVSIIVTSMHFGMLGSGPNPMLTFPRYILSTIIAVLATLLISRLRPDDIFPNWE